MPSSAIDNLTQAQQGATNFQIQIALQKTQLDAIKQQGAAVAELLQSAAQLSKAVGTGDGFDAVA